MHKSEWTILRSGWESQEKISLKKINSRKSQKFRVERLEKDFISL